MAEHRSHQEQARSKQISRERYPADRKKGERERGLAERYGQRKDDMSTDRGGDRHGASDVGQDGTSGGEYLDVDPTRFPERIEEDEERGKS